MVVVVVLVIVVGEVGSRSSGGGSRHRVRAHARPRRPHARPHARHPPSALMLAVRPVERTVQPHGSQPSHIDHPNEDAEQTPRTH